MLDKNRGLVTHKTKRNITLYNRRFEQKTGMMPNKYFISVDWGTSNLRIRLVRLPMLEVVEEIMSQVGIKVMYQNWLCQDRDRESFYLSYLIKQIEDFKSEIDPLTTMVISGMASSSIGLRELPYSELPFHSDGRSLYFENIESSLTSHKVLLISGVKSLSDVIRGEEVQIVGLSDKEDFNRKTLFLLTGTHSKHIMAENGLITNFKTFMTGEMFDVICNHTILKGSIQSRSFGQNEKTAFNTGVIQSKNNSSVLNSIFKVRTNSLFEKMSVTENYYYLSGLLIGEELKHLNLNVFDSLKLCAEGNLFELYYQALNILGLLPLTVIINKKDMDLSVIKGQWNVIKK